ncbi:ACP S-malonyltransferase [Nocardia sp. NBC_01499]|uniref:ACP S-malonyltransferase n=1 Tax=Nocardia sp. NBC_01499 TaxID=2903597 RepID=UPI00387094F6
MTAIDFGIVFPGEGISHELLEQALLRFSAHPLIRQLFAIFGAFQVDDLDLFDPAVAQPVIYALGIVAVQSRFGRGTRAPLVFGHSLGELTAAACAGVIDVDSGLHLALKRGRLCRNAHVPGAMVSVVAPTLDAIERLRRSTRAAVPGVLEVAAINSGCQAVLSGDAALVAKAIELAGADGLRAELLPIDGAQHSSRMIAVLPAWRRAVQAQEFRSGHSPLLCAIDARQHTDPNEIRELLIRALPMPVRWSETLATAREFEFAGLLDAGPGQTLVDLTRRDPIVPIEPMDNHQPGRGNHPPVVNGINSSSGLE